MCPSKKGTADEQLPVTIFLIHAGTTGNAEAYRPRRSRA